MNRKRDHGDVIVALVEEPATTAALPVGRRLAQLEQATLRILLIADPATPAEEGLARLGLDQDDLFGAILARAAGPIVPATLEVAEHWPGSTIVIAMSAVAPPEHAPEHAPELGHGLEELLAGAPGPLVLVPPLESAREWELKRILVPHDGSPTTGHAIGPAVSLAAAAGAELAVLHVASTGAAPSAEPGTMTTPLYIDQPQHEWPAWTREFRERLGAMMPTEKVPTTTILATGEPGREIVEHIADLGADLVVLGWHGDLTGTRATTLKTVVREARVPLMILRATAPREVDQISR